MKQPLTVAWISDLPVGWAGHMQKALRAMPRGHPAMWQMALLSEFWNNPVLRLRMILLRRFITKFSSSNLNAVTFHVLKAATWRRLATVFWADTPLNRRVCREIEPDLTHAWVHRAGRGFDR